MELNLHLEEMKKIPEMTDVSSLLQSELKRRFRKYTDPSDPDYEPLFLMSTMLDPWYRVLLNPTQAESSNKQLLKQLKEVAETIEVLILHFQSLVLLHQLLHQMIPKTHQQRNVSITSLNC